MRGLRPLLRLDDKVAAEGRRLQQLGGPPLRWLTPMTLLVAIVLHGALLLLPAVKTKAVYPQVSAAPDFPLVWRRLAPLPPADGLPPAAGETGAPLSAATVLAETHEALSSPEVPPSGASAPLRQVRPAKAWAFEPMPEPDPELAVTRIAAQVDALIPDPDPPPIADVGPQTGSQAAAADAAAAPVSRVRPAYPAAARSLNAEGRVRMRVAVLPDGTVAGAIVESCSRPGIGFEESAMAAVRQWRYEPAQNPRSVIVTIDFARGQVNP